jgi:choline dehydrogenase-like flavoprotein
MATINTTEVCIIGSGAGGSVVAKELGEQGISVVILEAGKKFNPIKDFTVSTSIDWERVRIEHLKKFRSPKMDTLTTGGNSHKPQTVFGVGGGTLRYLAYYIRMLPDDFRIYSLDGVGADWPITYEELAPYYRKVEKDLGVSGKSGDPWFPPIEKYPCPAFDFSYTDQVLKKSFDKLGIKLWPIPVGRLSRPYDGRPACVKCGTCDFGCMIKAKCSANVTYIPKAESTGNVEVRPESIATQIKVDSKGRARSVIYFDKDDLEHELKAKIIVVSAGTIQSPRLLLNSKSSLFPDGLANSSGLVGKYFMQHLSVPSEALIPDRVDSFRGYGNAMSFDFAKTDKRNSFARGWYMKPKNVRSGPAAMAIRTPGWGSWHKSYMRKNFGNVVGITTVGEQMPDERNRVELDPDVVDHYGIPVPRIVMKYGDNDKLMLKAMEKKIQEIYSIANVTKILKMRRSIPGGNNHNMGTCRMGDDPDTSVVNSYCQSHDAKNLFVVDASCFVTSGTANPSLTIQAIAKRSSEHIIEEVKKGNL